MALSLAQKFINLGMASPLAVEYANQINTGVYNWRRLAELGMVPILAKYVAESLAVGAFSGRIAMEKTMTEALANLTTSVGYSPEAVALFARMTTQLSVGRKALINDLIVALKAAGVWTKLDVLHVMAAADSQTARQNWLADQYNLTPVSAPVFTPDQGYQGDGASSYLSTGFNPATAIAPKYSQNDSHHGLWSRTNLLNGAGASFDSGSGTTWIRRSTTPGQSEGRPQQSATVTVANGSYPGHSVWSRSAAALWAGYAQGAPGGSGIDASSAVSNAVFRVLAEAAGGFGSNQIAAMHVGGNLTSTQTAALFSALNTYLTAVGAA